MCRLGNRLDGLRGSLRVALRDSRQADLVVSHPLSPRVGPLVSHRVSRLGSRLDGLRGSLRVILRLSQRTARQANRAGVRQYGQRVSPLSSLHHSHRRDQLRPLDRRKQLSRRLPQAFKPILSSWTTPSHCKGSAVPTSRLTKQLSCRLSPQKPVCRPIK